MILVEQPKDFLIPFFKMCIFTLNKTNIIKKNDKLNLIVISE